MRTMPITAIFLFAGACCLHGECPSSNPNDEKVCLSRINISGPRLGMTGIVDNSDYAVQLAKHHIGRAYSQFGWQFEFKVVPEGNGPSFVTEIIPMLGAVEYGTVIPSVTVPLGVRFPNGLEFGLGPNVTITGAPGAFANTSVVFAVGKTFSYRGVGIPLNVALTRGPGGLALSTSFGYAIVKTQAGIQGSNAY